MPSDSMDEPINTHFRFLDLPREVRDLVYHFQFRELPRQIRIRLKDNTYETSGNFVTYGVSYGETSREIMYQNVQERKESLKHARWLFLSRQIFLEAQAQFYRTAFCMLFKGRFTAPPVTQNESLAFFVFDRIRTLHFMDSRNPVEILLRPLPEGIWALVSKRTLKADISNVFHHISRYGGSIRTLRLAFDLMIFDFDKHTLSRCTPLNVTDLSNAEPILDKVEFIFLQPRLRPIQNAWILCTAFRQIQEQLLDMAKGLIRDPVSATRKSSDWAWKVRDRVHRMDFEYATEFEWRLEVQKWFGQDHHHGGIYNKGLPGISEICPRIDGAEGLRLRSFERVWDDDSGLDVYESEEKVKIQILDSQIKILDDS